MATEFGKRVKLARQHAGYKSQQALADALGVPQSTIGSMESKGTGSPLTARIAALCKVSAVWLADNIGEMLDEVTPIDLEGNEDYPAIRRVHFKLSAGASGFGIEYLNDEGAPIVFQRQWYEHRGFSPKKLFAVKIMNASMEPGLHDGDTVVVNTAQAVPKDGVVFAINYEGELVIKRLVRDAGQWWLSSDNPDQRRFPRKVCHEDCIVIGEIIHKQSERI